MTSPVIAVSGLNAVDSPGPGVATLRSLKEGGFQSLLGLAYDVLEPGCFMNSLVQGAYVLPYPGAGPERLLERLHYIRQNTGLEVVIPTLDAEVENFIALAPALKEEKISTLLPAKESFRKRNKAVLAENIAREIVAVPQTIACEDFSALREKLADLNWPLFLKGRFYDAYRVNTVEEAAGIFQLVAGRWGLPVLAQQAIEGEEYNLVALASKGKMLRALAMKKLFLTDKGKAWAGVTIKNEKLLEIGSRVIEHLNFTGACELEFIIEKEKVYLLEMNPRIPAWVYLATRAGMNIPAGLVKLALGETLAENFDYQVGMVFVRHSWDEIIPMESLDSLSTSGEISYRD